MRIKTMRWTFNSTVASVGIASIGLQSVYPAYAWRIVLAGIVISALMVLAFYLRLRAKEKAGVLTPADFE